MVLGDGATGKTCMGIVLSTNTFPWDYIPTTFDIVNINHRHKRTDYSFGFWDTAGGEDYDRLRPLGYPNTNVILIVFSLVAIESFQNVTNKWVPEVEHFMPNIPWILVGTKSDLRQDPERLAYLQEQNQRGPITNTEANDLVSRYNGAGYVEISSLQFLGLQDLLTLLSTTHHNAHNATAQAAPRRNTLCALL